MQYSNETLIESTMTVNKTRHDDQMENLNADVRERIITDDLNHYSGGETESIHANSSRPSVGGELSVKDVEDISNVPVKLLRILNNMRDLKARMIENRKEAQVMCNEMTNLEKMIEKYANKIAKEQTKTHTDKLRRKPSGFASPTEVSDELCTFMGKPVGTLISRTETSKFLSNYISTNHLYHETNKSVILPDDKLSQLLGNSISDSEITYFSIQKYINRHFKKTESRRISGYMI